MSRRQSSRNFLQIDTPDRNSCDVYRRCGPSATDPAILAQFSFVAIEAEGVGVFWGFGPGIDNAVPQPPGRGEFSTTDGPEGFSVVASLPGATECPLRIEIFQNGEPFVAIDLPWDSDTEQHISGGPAPVPTAMVVGESYTGLIRQLPCE